MTHWLRTTDGNVNADAVQRVWVDRSAADRKAWKFMATLNDGETIQLDDYFNWEDLHPPQTFTAPPGTQVAWICYDFVPGRPEVLTQKRFDVFPVHLLQLVNDQMLPVVDDERAQDNPYAAEVFEHQEKPGLWWLGFWAWVHPNGKEVCLVRRTLMVPSAGYEPADLCAAKLASTAKSLKVV